MAAQQDQMDQMNRMKIFVFCLLFFVGCAASGPATLKPAESVGVQMDAAQKVVGALSPDKGAAEKYSPVTGKHYSGALEYEPGTGVKLVPVGE